MFSPRSTPAAHGQKTIFVVNDETELVELFQDLLESEGYRVAASTDGLGCHRQIKAMQPDLVILDLVLIDVPKFHVLQMIKLDPATAELPVIVCSAAIPELRAMERRLHEQGCEVLPKPFGLDELLALIARLTGGNASPVSRRDGHVVP